MLTPWEFFTDLTNPLLVFLPKALLVAVVCSCLLYTSDAADE